MDGAHIAKNLYGARGWMAHHNTDIWRQAGPVSGSAVWSIFQVGSAWLCQHLWEHYAFSGDTDYLRRVWPTLKGAARFYLDYLMEEPSHSWLVTGAGHELRERVPQAQRRDRLHLHGADGQHADGARAVPELRGRPHGFSARTPSCARRSRRPCRACRRCRSVRRPASCRNGWRTGSARRSARSCRAGAPSAARKSRRAARRNWPPALRKIFDRRKWWKGGLVGSWQGAFQANVYARLGDGDTALAVFDTHLRRSREPQSARANFQRHGRMGNRRQPRPHRRHRRDAAADRTPAKSNCCPHCRKPGPPAKSPACAPAAVSPWTSSGRTARSRTIGYRRRKASRLDCAWTAK